MLTAASPVPMQGINSPTIATCSSRIPGAKPIMEDESQKAEAFETLQIDMYEVLEQGTLEWRSWSETVRDDSSYTISLDMWPHERPKPPPMTIWGDSPAEIAWRDNSQRGGAAASSACSLCAPSPVWAKEPSWLKQYKEDVAGI